MTTVRLEEDYFRLKAITMHAVSCDTCLASLSKGSTIKALRACFGNEIDLQALDNSCPTILS